MLSVVRSQSCGRKPHSIWTLLAPYAYISTSRSEICVQTLATAPSARRTRPPGAGRIPPPPSPNLRLPRGSAAARRPKPAGPVPGPRAAARLLPREPSRGHRAPSSAAACRSRASAGAPPPGASPSLHRPDAARHRPRRPAAPLPPLRLPLLRLPRALSGRRPPLPLRLRPAPDPACLERPIQIHPRG